MSDEIICLSSDDEDACTKTSNFRPEFNSVSRKRGWIDSSFDNKAEAKKPKIDNGIIDLDEYEEKSKLDSKFNSNDKKSDKIQSTTEESENESTRKRIPSPVAGTSKYFDLIENKVPKKVKHDKKEKRIRSVVSEDSKMSKKIFNDEQNRECSTPIPESPIKRVKPELIVKERVPIPDSSDIIFEKIFDTCAKKSNENDYKDINIILQKVKNYFNQLDSTDKNCEEFRIFLSSCLNQIISSKKCYKSLQDIREECIRRIKRANQDKVSNEAEEVELSEEDGRKVKILEHKIKECKRKIEKFENEEVDFDEEENSSYLKVDRYKKKMVELCNELSKIANDRILKNQIHKKLLRRKDISDEMTGIIYVDDAIIRFVNASIKKANELKHIKNPNAVASCLFMPDYVDILQCIKKCNEERKLELKNKKMEKLAEKAFKAVGHFLKNQRLRETSEYLTSYVESSEGDPAKNNQDLLKKLKNNKEVGMKKLEGIFAKYVEKQEGATSEDSDSEINENDSCEYESNEEDNSTGENENISHSKNKDNVPSEDESNSLDKEDKDKSQVSKKRIIPTILSDDDEAEIPVATAKVKQAVETIETIEIEKSVETDEIKEVVKIVQNKETSKEKNEIDKNELNKENIDTEKSNASEETSSPKRSTNLTDTTTSITHENEVEKKIQPSKKTNETVTVLLEIYEVSNSLGSDKDKPNCELVNDEIEILSDTSETKKEDSETLVLEVEDEDRFSVEDYNKNENTGNSTVISDVNCAKDNCTSISDTNRTEEEKKRKTKGEKSSDHEVQEKKIEHSDERSAIEIDSKDSNDSDSTETINENNILKETNVDRLDPLQTRDNHEKLVTKSDQSIISRDSSEKEEFRITSNGKASSADEAVVETRAVPFLKVKSFARSPVSWMDLSAGSPAKIQKLRIQQPIKQVLQEMSKPECVDLTNENENRSSLNTKFINPLAFKKRQITINKLVGVKDINNYKNSLPTDGARGNKNSVPPSKVQLVNPQVNKNFLSPSASSVPVNQVLPNNHNRRPNDTARSIVATPFVTLASIKKKNVPNSPSTVK